MIADKEKVPRDIKERTFSFALDVVHLAQRLDERSGVSRALGRQLLRSGTSVGANVEEAQAGQSHADFSSKYAIALKETPETTYWLWLLKEGELSPNKDYEGLLREADEIARIIGAISSKVGEIVMNRDAECHDIVDTQQIDRTFVFLLLPLYFFPRGPQPSENEIVPFSSDPLRLANALSALYPKEKEEKRLIRALLRGATAMAPGS